MPTDPKAAAAAAVPLFAPAPASPLVEALFELPPLRHTPERIQPFLGRGIDLLAYAFLFLVFRSLIRRIVRRASETVAAREESLGNHGRAARIRTLASLTRSILIYALGFVFLVAALGVLGFNVAGVIGTAGVAGLAVGFGAQKLVKDMISGFFLLLEDQYAVGDYVTIGAVTGTVEELGMRSTRLRDDDGRLFILSNGDITQVCNMSRGPVAGRLEIGIAASADTAKATGVLDAALAAASESLALADPARVEGIVQADAAKTVLRVLYRTSPSQRPADVALPLREAAHAALRDAEIPLA